MDFYTLNVAFLVTTLVAYFVTQGRSIKLDRIVSGVLFLAFLCLIAFRPTSVRDTVPYIEAFNMMDSYQFSLGLGRVALGANMEISFANLLKLVSLFTSSYQVFFFIVALLTVGISTISILLISSSMHEGQAIKYRILPAFLLFVSYYGFLYTGIVLRAGLALAFCLLSYAMVFRRRYIFAILVYLTAFSFHNSVLFFLVIFFVYFLLPTFTIRTYRIMALTIIGLYVVRFFDLFQNVILRSASLLASLLPFFSFFNFYLSGEYLTSSFLLTIVFFMFEIVYLTFCFDDSISKQYKKNLNALLIVSIIAALFGAFPVIVRVLDVLFIVMIPALYYTVIGIPSDERISFGKRLSVRKLPIFVLGIGVISIGNFLLYSRLAGYLAYK